MGNNSDDPSTDEDGMGHLAEGKNKPRSTVDHTKRHIDRLMSRIDKPINIPGKMNTDPKAPKDYIRNVQGSSAGAGSGEFHVYRALRRKEYARLKMMETKSKEEEVKKEYQDRIDKIKAAEDEKTAKKREKRKKRKQKGKDDGKKRKTGKAGTESEADGSQQDKEDADREDEGEPRKSPKKTDGSNASEEE
ncbi:hypothetical protein BC829DRAFT_122730 [Chytridium lagenaria]|nr:hypothetical protein BC829DRAFT_122730 [Chytridium lagenaria]